MVENRLFSEGLHCLGAPPSEQQMAQYLEAYFGEELPAPAVEAVAATRGDLAQVKDVEGCTDLDKFRDKQVPRCDLFE